MEYFGQREGEDDLKKAKRRQAMLGKGSEINYDFPQKLSEICWSLEGGRQPSPP